MMSLIRQTAIPVIMVQDDTFMVAAKIDHLIVKIRPTDTEKIRSVESLIEEHVNVNRVLDLISTQQ